MPSLWADSLDEHRELVLGKVLAAYEALRAEVGVEAVTLTAVAQRAGIARSALYNYVKDKHGLVLLHAERTMGGAEQQLRTGLAGVDGAAARLRRFIAMNMAMYAAVPAAADDLMPLLDAEEQQRMRDALAPIRAMLHEIVADGVASGDFRGRTEDLVELLSATIGGYRLPVASGRVDPQRAAEVVGEVLLAGLQHAALPPEED